MYKPFSSITRNHLKDALTSHFYILIGSLLPIWFTPIMLKLFSTEFSYTDLIDHGEFALYAAALITPALYLITKEHQAKGFPYRRGFVISSFIILIISVGLFSGVIVSSVGKANTFVLNKYFLRYMTIGLLFFSILLSLFVSILDNSLMTPDMAAIKEKEREELENKFDQTEKN